KLRRLPGLGDPARFIVQRINWHEIVELPAGEERGLLNDRQLAGLVRGLIGAAARVARPARWTGHLLDVVLLGAPAALFLALLAGLVQLRHAAHGSHAAAWLQVAADSTYRLVTQFLPDFVGASAGPACRAYLLAAAGLAALHFVVTAVRNDLRSAARVMALAAFRPLVVFTTAWVSPPAFLLIFVSIVTWTVGTMAQPTVQRVPL